MGAGHQRTRQRQRRGRKDALQSHRASAAQTRADEKKQTHRELTGQEGSDIIAVGVQGKLGEGSLEVGKLTDGREHC